MKSTRATNVAYPGAAAERAVYGSKVRPLLSDGARGRPEFHDNDNTVSSFVSEWEE